MGGTENKSPPTGSMGGIAVFIYLEEKALGWWVRSGGNSQRLGPGQDIPEGCSVPVSQALGKTPGAEVLKTSKEIRVAEAKAH